MGSSRQTATVSLAIALGLLGDKSIPADRGCQYSVVADRYP
jgi:hypothetical protein